MNYHTIEKDNMLNGEGLRVVLWVSGCEMGCIACHNPETHYYKSGIPFDKNAENELFEALKPDYIDGLTLSGGHPLMECNLKDVNRIIDRFKKEFTNKTIWLYTGYTWEQIQEDSKRKEIVDKVDILCDGRFNLLLKDDKCHWVGSSNQRVIDVQKSLEKNEVVLYE